MTPLGSSLLIAAVLAAAVIDIRERRIPNTLTGSLAALSLVAHVAEGPWAVAGAAGAGAVVFAIGVVAHKLGWFGGGDVKLLAASACAVGVSGALSLGLYVMLAGGAVALADAAYHRRLRPVLGGCTEILRGQVARTHDGVPYGVAIAAGACTYVLSATIAPFLRLPLS